MWVRSSFKIDFGELTYPEDPDETRKQWAFDLKVGAKNILQYVKEVNPDIKDDDTAEEFIKTNNEINKRVQVENNINFDNVISGLLKLGSNGNTSTNAGGGSSQSLI